MFKLIVIVFSVKSSFMFENTTPSLEECIQGVEILYEEVIERKEKGASFQCVVRSSGVVEYEKFYNVEFYPEKK